ncbi:hypothetical protein [Thalassoroseus pseudoceratinae]|uniref:hypothetical protein n=1 Tax=Thalassoroseus pseudoceratinae TaxID=2713176 RepID=UPI00141E551D|nr:hypothetical protein [Thalassoroseus pseudoceratinae]
MSNELKQQDQPQHHHEESELERWGKAVMAWLEKNGMQLAIGLAVVAVIAAIGIFWSRSAAATKAARWEPMITANDAERFAEISDEFSGTVVADWARLKESQRALAEGIQLSMTDREGSIAELTRAREVLEGLLKDDISDIIRERALYALGNTMETLAGVNVGEDGENVDGVEPAIEVYQRLVQTFPNSVFFEPAQKRIAALKSPDTQEFYAWYKKQDPSPADREGPNDNQNPAGAASEFRPPASPNDGPMLPGGTDQDALNEFENLIKDIEAEKAATEEDASEATEESKPAAAEKAATESATEEEASSDSDGPALPTPDANDDSATESDAK